MWSLVDMKQIRQQFKLGRHKKYLFFYVWFYKKNDGFRKLFSFFIIINHFSNLNSSFLHALSLTVYSPPPSEVVRILLKVTGRYRNCRSFYTVTGNCSNRYFSYEPNANKIFSTGIIFQKKKIKNIVVQNRSILDKTLMQGTNC
jgi:hypothetical protein